MLSRFSDDCPSCNEKHVASFVKKNFTDENLYFCAFSALTPIFALYQRRRFVGIAINYRNIPDCSFTIYLCNVNNLKTKIFNLF